MTKSHSPAPESPWFRPEQAAAYLGIEIHTLRRYRRSGKVPCYKLTPKTFLYNRADLDAFVQAQFHFDQN